MSKIECIRQTTKLFETLEKKNRSNDIRRESPQGSRFWRGISDQPVRHNKKMQWLKKAETQLTGGKEQKNITITSDYLQKQLRKLKTQRLPKILARWSARILDKGTYIFPWKNSCMTSYAMPRNEWETRRAHQNGKIILIIKGGEKGDDITNCGPKTCLPLMWKIFSGILSGKRYDHLEIERNKSGAAENCVSQKDHLLTDKEILGN